MKTSAFFRVTVLFAVVLSLSVHAQNVGIGTNAPPAKLSVIGTGNSPAIPGGTSNGIFRLGVTYLEGLDFGKLATTPYSAWMQAGYDGEIADPISIAPLGGNVGIGILSPAARLHVAETGSGQGVLFTGEYQATPGNPAASGAGTRFMWYPDKAAIRCGYVAGTYWNKDSIGTYSAAFGYNTKAKGSKSFAFGDYTSATGTVSIAMGMYDIASGSNSLALGTNNLSNGSNSVVIGTNLEAPSAYEIVLGRNNLDYTPASSINWISTDRLFVIGNGAPSDESNAITVLKNGNIGIGTAYPNALLHVQGIGNGKGVVFEGNYDGTSPADVPVSGAGVRMMWYPDKASFRVGRVSATRWDADSVGNYSFASNYNTKASQSYAFAIGNGCVADGIGTFAGGYQCQSLNSYCFCFGYNSISDAPYSTSLGYNTTATQQRSQAFGNNTTTQSAFETVFGRYNVEYTPLLPGGWTPDDQLFVVGFGTSDAARYNALTILKGGQTGLRSMTTPTYTLHLANNPASGDGKAQAYAWDTYSDERIKSDIRNLDYGLKEVMMLVPVIYFHHNSLVRNKEMIIEADGVPGIGFIAQDVYDIVPEVVTKPENEAADLWSMSYEKLIPLLTKAIQEQQAMIEELQKKVEQLENKLTIEY